MNLPETACISICGPQGLLDLGGFHWGDEIMFDSNSGGLDADAGFLQSTEVLKSLIIKDVLIEKCGYTLREIMFFGFGQGGMAALNLAGEYSYPPSYLKEPSLTFPSRPRPRLPNLRTRRHNLNRCSPPQHCSRFSRPQIQNSHPGLCRNG